MSRYHIDSLLGTGGFGSVYRARFVADGGFERVVAIKLLHADLPDDSLQRFRDEARMLGLVRDRAVVSVEPPFRLEDRWAVVMEYVDGMSIEQLLRRRGPLPCRVALEIVQEVARALSVVYDHPGPRGEPLHLLHRDIKPANLQVTPTGAVKVLDFGIAKASFDAREAQTTNMLMGTRSYMSPDRMCGHSSPADDIYALGLVLRRMVTGEKPIAPTVWGPTTEALEDDPERDRVVDLANRMAAIDASERPTAREAEDLCGALAQELGGFSLREWAEDYVAAAPRLRPDELVGETLSFADSGAPPASTNRVLWGGVVLIGTGAAMALGIVAALVVFFLFRPQQPIEALTDRSAPIRAEADVPEPEPVEAPAVSTDTEPDIPAADKAESPSPTETDLTPSPEAPLPAVEPSPPVSPPLPAPVDAAEPLPSPEVRTEPPPNVEPALPAPLALSTPADEPAVAALSQPAVPTVPVTFGSWEAGAEVEVDGVSLGATPLIQRELAVGSHTVVLKLGDATISREIEVGDRQPSRFIWRGGDRWEAYVD